MLNEPREERDPGKGTETFPDCRLPHLRGSSARSARSAMKPVLGSSAYSLSIQRAIRGSSAGRGITFDS